MPPGIGYSFQPGADQSMQGPGGQGGRSVAPPSSSVKVLSYRMPKRDVRGQVAPSALLNASGGGGQQTGGLSPRLLSLLLSAFSAGPQQAQQGPFGDGGSSDPAGVVGPGPRFATPRFTIGEGGGGPFRLPDDLGPAMAAGPGGGDLPPMGGAPNRVPPDRSSGSPMPRYKMLDDLQSPLGGPLDARGSRMFF